MSKPVAIVTGAASGMGLALTRHLVRMGWKVGMAALNEVEGEKHQSELGVNVLFRKLDITVYEEHAAFFAEVFAWGGDRLDFLAANAGVTEIGSFYKQNPKLDKQGLPLPPNMKCLDVDVKAQFYSVWLFQFFARKNDKKGGKIVLTASAAGIYPVPNSPQYAAAKHGLVGLGRSVAKGMRKDNVTVNVICPSFVNTNLIPDEMRESWPQEHWVPMHTVMRAFDMCIQNDQMSGEVLELSQDQIFPRQTPDYPSESQRWLNEGAGKFAKFWDSGRTGKL